jgi:drug/metabolite transporter (DMT)-like permease
LLLAPRLPTLLVTRHFGLQLVRSGFLFGATITFFFSISRMGLAEVVAIFEINPLIITILAFIFLKEPVGIRRLLGVSVGLIGALIIIRPGAAVFAPISLLPLLSALCFAAYAISTRFLGRDEHILTSLLYTTLVGTIVASLIVPTVWTTPTPRDAALMLCLGFLGGSGQYLLIKAFTITEAAVVAPFSYVGLIFAVVFGYFLFDDLPDTATIIGALVIVSSGLYVWNRERLVEQTKHN